MSSTEPAEIERLLAQTAWVHRLALAVARDPHAADDIAQEFWVAALHRPGSGGRGLRAWIASVVRNLARLRARNEARREARERAAARPDREEGPELALERLEAQEELLRSVRELAEPYRTTVILRWFDGLEPAEIARRSGVPVRTVHTRITRALRILRERLDRRSRGDRPSWTSAWIPILSKQASPCPWIFAMQAKSKIAIVGIFLVAGLATVIIRSPTDSSPDGTPDEFGTVESLRPVRDEPAVVVKLPAVESAARAAAQSTDTQPEPLAERPSLWTIEGTVRTSGKEAIPGAKVTPNTQRNTVLETDQGGHFTFASSRWRDLQFLESFGVTCEGFVSRCAPIALPAEFFHSRLASFEVSLVSGLRVMVLVVDEWDQPVSGARVMIRADDGQGGIISNLEQSEAVWQGYERSMLTGGTICNSATSTANGVAGLSAEKGTYFVGVWKHGYQCRRDIETRWEVKEAGDSLRYRLERGRILMGQVTDASHQGLPDVMVVVETEVGNGLAGTYQGFRGSAVTDSGGNFEIGGLGWRLGIMNLVAHHELSGSTYQRVSNPDIWQEIVLRPSLQVVLRLEDAETAAPISGSVRIQWEGVKRRFMSVAVPLKATQDVIAAEGTLVAGIARLVDSIKLSCPGYAPEVIDLHEYEDAERFERTIQLKKDDRHEIRVVDQESGDLLLGAHLLMAGGGLNEAGRTFSFSGPVPSEDVEGDQVFVLMSHSIRPRAEITLTTTLPHYRNRSVLYKSSSDEDAPVQFVIEVKREQ